MSHSDIKPTNVLVFRDGNKNVYAKLADFGYAGWAISNTNRTLVYPPKSWPWNAPEHHYRGFTVFTAQKMDVYSFGLLVLWVLFFDKPCVELDRFDRDEKIREPLNDPKIMDQMKAKDELRAVSCQLIDTAPSLSPSQKADLRQFFLVTLAYDVQSRAADPGQLINLLGHGW